jgi:hypothetical protein
MDPRPLLRTSPAAPRRAHTASVDRAGGVLDHERPEPGSARVAGDQTTQKSVARPARNTCANPRSRRHPAPARSASRRPRRRLEGRVGVDLRPIAFANSQLSVRNLEISVEIGAGRAPHAVVRPERLRSARERNRLEWFLARVRGGKRDVVRRVPVLRQHRMLERAGASPLMIGITSSPPFTGRVSPGMKQFCTSTRRAARPLRPA